MSATHASIFPTWRDKWMSLDGASRLLTEADNVIRKRAAGNQRLPKLTDSDSYERADGAVRLLGVWAQDKLPQNISDVSRGYQIVRPLLRATAWPRWLFLERAFLDASCTGDLLFAALLLRTMAEEVLRQHALDINVEKLDKLTVSGNPTDQKRLKLFFFVAWTQLDTLPERMVMEGKDWPSCKLLAEEMPALEQARTELNSYVHPNYGSHNAALFPESSAAATLLLKAVIEVYSSFYALSWATEQLAGPAVASLVGPCESWTRTIRRFQSRTLSEIHRSESSGPLTEVLKVPALMNWLANPREDCVALLADPLLAALVSGLPCKRRDTGSRKAEYIMWDGASACDVIRFASVRRAEQMLATEFPGGAPETKDQIPWLRFNARSLELAMLIDATKAAALKTQLVRQIVHGNSLAVLLCARSLIEHRALSVWVPQQIKLTMDSLAKDVKAEEPLSLDALHVSLPLASYLSYKAKKTKEDQRSWVFCQHGNVRTTSINLAEIMRSAFPKEDRFHKVYAISSAAMHGRLVRSKDLLFNTKGILKVTRDLGLLVLARLCDPKEEMHHLSNALVQFIKFEHAADFGGTARAKSDKIARQAFGHLTDPLIQNVDYYGEGTVENPFFINSNLQFHQASRALLEQIGIDLSKAQRVLDKDASGALSDIWNCQDNKYWIRLPTMPGETR